MKKNLIILVLVFAIAKLYGQEYYVIDFVGEGAAIESIYVENLTQDINVELDGGQVLHLILDPVEVSAMEKESKKITIFPNPMSQTVNIEFFNAKQGNVDIRLYNIEGKQIHYFTKALIEGKHTFSLSGVAAGSYIISVKTETCFFTGKLISLDQSTSSFGLLNHKHEIKLNNTIENTNYYEPKLRNTLDNKGVKSIVEMNYSIGDELKFTGYSEGFENSVIFDSPTSDNTYNFVFTKFICGQPFTDPRDGYIYQTVQMGEQCWIAQNLAYLPDITYKNSWGSYTQPQYGVSGYEPGSGTETVEGAKASEHYENYGVLYNWAAAMDGGESSQLNPSGVQGICPPGWHLPSNAEWVELLNFVDSQGFPNSNVVNGAANALKSCRQVDSPLGGNCDTSEHPRWNSDETHYGFDEFGFNALPAGIRDYFGTYGYVGIYVFWWTTMELNEFNAMYRDMRNLTGSCEQCGIDKRVGRSVRCVREN